MDADTEQAVQLLATSAQGTVLYQHHLCCGNCALCMKWYLRAHRDVIFEYTQKGKLQLKRICWLADLLLSSRDCFPKEQLSSLFMQPKTTSCNTYQQFPCLGLYHPFNDKNLLYNIRMFSRSRRRNYRPPTLPPPAIQKNTPWHFTNVAPEASNAIQIFLGLLPPLLTVQQVEPPNPDYQI